MTLMAAKDRTGIPKSLTIDDISRSLINVDFDMNMLHEGKKFMARYSETLTDINEFTALAFNTPAADIARIHMIVRAQVSDSTLFLFLEDPTIDEAGATAAVTPWNQKRDSDITSKLYDVTPVKATGGNLAWTGVAQELDSFSIGDDVYLITALEATATAANPNAIWIALGDAQPATMDGVAITAIDDAQAASNNDQTVEAAQGSGTDVDLDADGFGTNGNLAVTIIVGANMTATDLSGGVGAVQADGEIYGAVNSLSGYDFAEGTSVNIDTSANALINETIFGGTGVHTWDSRNGELWAARAWILKPGYQYCAYLKNLNNEDNDHLIHLEWFEHIHKTQASDF
jgi:hypothetical protein